MKNWNKIKGFYGETLFYQRSFNTHDLQIKKLSSGGWEATNRALGLNDHPDYQENYGDAFFGVKKTFKTATAAADYLMKSCLFLEESQI